MLLVLLVVVSQAPPLLDLKRYQVTVPFSGVLTFNHDAPLEDETWFHVNAPLCL